MMLLLQSHLHVCQGVRPDPRPFDPCFALTKDAITIAGAQQQHNHTDRRCCLMENDVLPAETAPTLRVDDGPLALYGVRPPSDPKVITSSPSCVGLDPECDDVSSDAPEANDDAMEAADDVRSFLPLDLPPLVV